MLGPRQLWLRLRTELAKRIGSGHKLEELSASLAGKELFFEAPPLTRELIRAIKAITPQFSLHGDEESRRVWELSQNGSSWAEYDALAPLLETIAEPRKVLEIGPGMGRSVVFLRKKMGWSKAEFHLYEADGDARKYPLNAPRSSDSFCGDLASLELVLAHNGVTGCSLFDAHALGYRLDRLPGPYDLVYSFYGVGFHWSLADFWSEIRTLLTEQSIAIFTVHHTFEPFSELAAMPHRYVRCQRILAKDRPLRLLVVSPDASRLSPLDRAR